MRRTLWRYADSFCSYLCYRADVCQWEIAPTNACRLVDDVEVPLAEKQGRIEPASTPLAVPLLATTQACPWKHVRVIIQHVNERAVASAVASAVPPPPKKRRTAGASKSKSKSTTPAAPAPARSGAREYKGRYATVIDGSLKRNTKSGVQLELAVDGTATTVRAGLEEVVDAE